jgi:dihydroorotate dehydrogenase (NAD+) catalytic subunit
MGGVMSADDVLDLVAAGASAVALGTVLFSDPLSPGRIRAELGATGTPSPVVSTREIHGFARGFASGPALSAD